MHVDDNSQIGARGDGPWRRNHLPLDHGVDPKNSNLECHNIVPLLNRSLQKQESRQD